MIPSKLILQLLMNAQTILDIREEGAILPTVLSEFARNETKQPDSRLCEIACYIEQQHIVPHLTQIDIMNAMLSIIRFVFQQRYSSESSRFEIFSDPSLSYAETVRIPIGISQTFKEILHGTDLSPEFATLIETLLIHLDSKFAALEWSFELRVPTQTPSPFIGKQKVEDRVFIDIAQNELSIVGKYKGSSVAAAEHMAADLSLIFALLEFEKTIVDRNDKTRMQVAGINNKPRKMGLGFTFAKDFNSIDIAYLKNHYETRVDAFEVRNLNMLPPELFQLLNTKFSRPVLKSVIYFFHSERTRLPTFRFLQYWCAIETMLGSPDEHIRQRLCDGFLLVLPENTREDFALLWNTRNGVVHRGILNVDSGNLRTIEQDAKLIFYRLFRMVVHHTPM